MKSRLILGLLLWFALFRIGTQQQQVDGNGWPVGMEDTGEGECVEWGYEPLVDFIYPEFGQSTARPLIVAEETFGDIELLDEHTTTPAHDKSLLGEFHGPMFEEVASTAKPIGQQQRWELPDEFHAPQFQTTPPSKQLPDEFHAPAFEQQTKKPTVDSNVYDDIELLDLLEKHEPKVPSEFHAPQFEQSSSTPSSQWEMPSEFHAPQFEQPTSTPSSQWEMPSDFHAPQFEQVSNTPPVEYGLPEDFHAPRFEDLPMPGEEELADAGTLTDDYGVPKFVPSQQQQWQTTTKSYPKPVPIKHDVFVNGHLEDEVKTERVRLPSDNVEVHDEFVAVEEKDHYPAKKRIRKPLPYIEPKTTTDSYKPTTASSAKVRDDFASIRDEKTHVEPVTLPPSYANVHDEFANKQEKKQKKVVVKPETEEEEHWYDPVGRFLLNLVGAEASVHDSFTQGVEDKTTIEPISHHPASKVKVHDEFTVGSSEKKKESDGYRSKRSPVPSPKDSSLWKLVCTKRRPVLPPKPAPRTLTSADFVEFAKTANDHISRCIGRLEGENVAAGLCRKHYLRCAPTISVLMCTRMGEVFSEARKACVSKMELSECNLARSIGAKLISFSVNKTEDDLLLKEKLLDLSNGDMDATCMGKPDGFYRDNTNCSRALQCFDNALFEYPSCTAPLVFDVKRELCDYRERAVPSCSN